MNMLLTLQERKHALEEAQRNIEEETMALRQEEAEVIRAEFENLSGRAYESQDKLYLILTIPTPNITNTATFSPYLIPCISILKGDGHPRSIQWSDTISVLSLLKDEDHENPNTVTEISKDVFLDALGRRLKRATNLLELTDVARARWIAWLQNNKKE